jgi:MFS family permease
MTESVTVTTERRGFFVAFRYSQYRLLWLSALGSNTSRWMETVVSAWLVLEMTDSPFMVGLIGACRTAGMLFGPFFGTIADRFSRHRILIIEQLILFVGSLAIAILFFTSQLEVWHLFAFVLVEGLCFALDFTARFPLASEIVAKEHLTNATALLFLTVGITSGIGPLLGGSLLGVIGAGGCFAIISACFLISLIALGWMRPGTRRRIASEQTGRRNLLDGLRYVRNEKPIFALVLIAAVLNFFVPPITLTLVPIFARDILQVGAIGLGQLMGIAGLGGVIGPLLVGRITRFEHSGKIVIAAAIGWPAMMMFFAGSRLFPLSLALILFAGLAQWLTWALIQTLLLQWSAEEMRGRVSGVRAFAIGALPLGSLLTGAMAGFWNAPVVLLIDASAAILVVLVIAFWASDLRKGGRLTG